jgi:hypothetical protein
VFWDVVRWALVRRAAQRHISEDGTLGNQIMFRVLVVLRIKGTLKAWRLVAHVVLSNDCFLNDSVAIFTSNVNELKE